MRAALPALVLVFVLISACSGGADPAAAEVDRAVVRFCDALAKGNETELRRVCGPGFTLLDEGRFYDLDQTIASIRSVLVAGTSMTRRPYDVVTSVRDDAAWSRYRVEGKLHGLNHTIDLDLLESVVLVKTSGVWQVVQVATQPAVPVNPGLRAP